MPSPHATEIKFGLVGLDTSHVIVFGDEFNNPQSEHAIPGGKIVSAWPGGSPDLEASIGRVEGYTRDLRDKYGVAIKASMEAVCETADAILLTSVDGRTHLEQFQTIAPFGKPVFIDKPFALDTATAKEIFSLAVKHGTPLFSSSSLRFSEAITRVFTPEAKAQLKGADFHGPVALEPSNPGYYWYGIHITEMLYTAMGTGCRTVRAVHTTDYEQVTGIWNDGRIGTLHGNRTGNYEYHGMAHFAEHSLHIDVAKERKSFFMSLGEAILAFAQTGHSPVPAEETIELIRFIEAANESRAHNGREVAL